MDQASLPESNQAKAEIVGISWQAGILVVRSLAFTCAVGVHCAINRWVLPFAIQPDLWRVKQFVEIGFAGAFSVVYLQQAYDMVTIFAPWARVKRKDKTHGDRT